VKSELLVEPNVSLLLGSERTNAVTLSDARQCRVHELRAGTLPSKSGLDANAVDIRCFRRRVSYGSAIAPIVVSLKAKGSSKPETQRYFAVASPDLCKKVRVQTVCGRPGDDPLGSRDDTSTRLRVTQEHFEEYWKATTSRALGRLHISE
jgi:hypothetical protein